jgi:formate-dependent phosphoribosylglycinamide formyltransferase (GAR transformylase)
MRCVPPAPCHGASALCCVTNNDAGVVIVALRKGFGFCFNDELTVVSNQSKCTSAVAAFSTATNLAGTPLALTKAVAISAGGTQYVVWSPDQLHQQASEALYGSRRRGRCNVTRHIREPRSLEVRR